MTAPLSREELALQEMLKTAESPVVVVLTDSMNPAGAILADRVGRLFGGGEGHTGVVVLGLAAYRRWALEHGVHGTPAVLAFRDGACVARILGTVDEETLGQGLRRAGVTGHASRASGAGPR